MKGTGIGIAAEALDIGMNGHLSKPINMDAVRELLGRLREE